MPRIESGIQSSISGTAASTASDALPAHSGACGMLEADRMKTVPSTNGVPAVSTLNGSTTISGPEISAMASL